MKVPIQSGSRPLRDAAEAADAPTFWQIIARQRGMIILCLIISAILGAIYMLKATPIYTASAELSVVRGAPTAGDPNQAAAVQQGSNYLYRQAEMLRSTPVIALAMRRAHSERMKMFHNLSSNRVGYVRRQLTIDVDRQDEVITAQLDAPDGDEAERLLTAIVACYQQSIDDQQQKTIDKKIAVYKTEKDRVDQELRDRHLQIDDLRKTQAAALAGGINASLQIQRAGAISAALTTAQLDTVAARAAFIQAARSAGGNIARGASNPNWDPDPETERVIAAGTQTPLSEDAAQSEVSQLRQQLAILRKQYLPGYPAIAATQSRLDQVESDLVNSARMRWLSAVDKERDLQKSFDELQKVANQQSSAASELDRLQGEIHRLEDRSDALDKIIRDLSYAVQAASVTINVISPATQLDELAAPRAYKVFPIALALGLAAGVGLSLLRESTTVRAAKRVRPDGRPALLGLPVLATIPRQLESSLKALALGAHLRPESPIAQAFGQVRNLIENPPPAGELDVDLAQARTILIASAVASEGRTSAAANLAISLAKSGKRVCLVDADFRTPALAKVFQAREETGLSNVLAGVENLTAAAQRTAIDRLDILPSGLTPRDPSALLNSEAFGQILEDLTLAYDIVVLDSPPVLASPDARIIAASCDVTLIIVGNDSASKRFAEQGREGLLAVGAQIAGIIVNHPPRRGPKISEDATPPTRPSVTVETHPLPQRQRA